MVWKNKNKERLLSGKNYAKKLQRKSGLESASSSSAVKQSNRRTKLDKNGPANYGNQRTQNGNRPSWAVLDTKVSEFDDDMADSDVDDLMAMVDRDNEDQDEDEGKSNNEESNLLQMEQKHLKGFQAKREPKPPTKERSQVNSSSSSSSSVEPEHFPKSEQINWKRTLEEMRLVNVQTKPTRCQVSSSFVELDQCPEEEQVNGKRFRNLLGDDYDQDELMEDHEIQDDNDDEQQEQTPKSFVEAFVRRQSSLEKLKEQLALISNSVMTYPELNITKLKNIFAILDTSVADPEYGLVFFSAQKLAIQSLCVVFNDIIPNYRVSERIKSDEMAAAGTNRQLKRETMRSLEFEKYLLSYYQLYLQRLQRILTFKQSNSDFYRVMLTTRNARSRLASVACQCLCEMLVHHYNFNNRAQLIEMLALALCNGNQGTEQMRQTCSKAFVKLFKADTLGEASLEAVKAISTLVVKYQYRVKPIVFETFLHLNLRELTQTEEEVKASRLNRKKQTAAAGNNKKDRKQMSRKERKRGKHMGKLQKELFEAEAVEDQEKRHQHKTKIHNELFALYFRFLRHIAEESQSSLNESWETDFEHHYRAIFGPLLQGIANYSIYLNDNYIYSLIDTIRELIQPGASSVSVPITATERLCCLRTIFQMLTLSGNLLTIDFHKLYYVFYEICSDLGPFLHSLPMLVDCFEEMLFKRFKQIPLRRVNSFLNRLVLMASHLSDGPAIAILSMVRRMLQLNPSNAAYLLDHSVSDEQFWESGITVQTLEQLPLDPDTDPSFQANSFQASLHRLATLHYSNLVRFFAQCILSSAALSSNFDQSLKKARQSAQLGGLSEDLCLQLSKARQPTEHLELCESSQMLMGQFGYQAKSQEDKDIRVKGRNISDKPSFRHHRASSKHSKNRGRGRRGK